MRLLRWLVLPVVMMFVFAACGDDNGSDSGSSSSSSSSSSAAKPATADVPAPPTTPPGEIQVTEPLTKTPPKGKRVIFLQCELPACARYVNGVKAATTALGWKADFQVFKGSAPAAALEQAVAQKPDYIAITGIPEAVLKAPLAKAHAANIPVISGADPEPPSEKGFALQVGGTLVPDAENILHWIIKDSGGKANMVAVTIPQFPVLNGETDFIKGELPKLCPDCSYDQLDVTIEDVGGGAVPSKLTGYLQSHPDVNYVFFTFSDLGKGIGPVLEKSGLDNVKLTGCCGDAGNAKEIASGDTHAWTIAPNEYSGYAIVDGMARLSVGMPITEELSKAVMPSPSWVVDSAASVDLLKPTGGDWPGPADYGAQFEKLWGVGA